MEESRTTERQARSGRGLVRAIGRWSLTAAVINSVIGSGIFGMPSAVAALVGAWSPLAVMLAGLSIFTIVLCFAEVGSRYEEAGGPYLYTRDAYGPLVGFQVGWLHVWTRLLSGAAVLNVLVSYLALLIPAAGTGYGRVLTMTAGMALVTAVNIRGVRQAAWAVNAFTVAKLFPLLLLIILGSFNLSREVLATQTVDKPGWIEALLLLVFAYGGFESSVVTASEASNPKRDTAFALVTGMAAVTLVYALVQLAVIGVLPHAARSTTPVASALGELLGRAGLALGSLAVVVSVYGWLTGFALTTPRILFSMAERGELPSSLAAVHARFRTPHMAVMVNSAIALGLGLYGSFTQTATLAAVTRLAYYGLTCGALIILRRRQDGQPGFRVPGGPAIALTGIAFCLWLLGTRNLAQARSMIAIMAAGALLWLLARRRNAPGATGI